MSIEQALAENTAAIKDLTAAVLAGNEGRAAVLEAAQAASTKATTAKASTKKTDDAAAEKPADKPAADTGDADGPTVEDVNAAITKYVGGTERVEERKARAAKVAAVLKKFSPEGTAKPNGATLAEDKRGAFIKTVDKWIEEGDLVPEAPAEDEASGDDDGLLG